MNVERWTVGLVALVLVLFGLSVCAERGRAATLRAENAPGYAYGADVRARFEIGGALTVESGPGVTQPDGKVLWTADFQNASWPALPIEVLGYLCRGTLCSAASAPLLVASLPTEPPPTPLPAPLIKTAIRVDPETIEARLKDYDTNTIGTYPYVVFEQRPEADAEWIEVDSWLAPSQVGLPSNERLWRLDAADPGCTGVRAKVLREGGQESPWSAAVTVGTCGQLPPPKPIGCEWDLDADGVVGGTDVLAWIAGWMDGTYTGRDWLALSAAFGTVCP